MITSNESSGVRTCTAPRMSSQAATTRSRAASAAMPPPWRLSRSATSAWSLPWPSTNTIRRVSPGSSAIEICSAAQGSRPATELIGELLVRERGRRGERAVAAEERGAVRGRRARRFARVNERHPRREIAVPGIARVERSGRRRALGHHVQAMSFSRRSQRPFAVEEDAQSPRAATLVGQREERELDRILDVDEDLELVAEAVRRAREACDPGAVANDTPAVAGATPHRPRCRRPGRAGLVVADEDRLAGGVAHRVAGMRCEPVLAAVAGPGEGGA